MYSHSAENKKPLRYVYVAIAGILAMALILAVIVWQQILDAARVRHALIQAHEAKSVSLQVLSTLLYAESTQRGYLLAGEDGFLASYDTLRDDLLHTVNVLINQKFDDPETFKLASSLADLAYERLEQLGVVMTLRNKQGHAAAVARIEAGRGQQLMAKIRALSNQLLERQEVNIAELAYEQRGRVANVRVTIALLMLGIVTLAISTAWLIAVYLRQRHHAETQLRAGMVRQIALFEGVLDALVIADVEGRIESINHAAQRMFGICPGDVKGKEFTVLTGATRQGRALAFEDIRKLADDGGSVLELTVAREGGELFPAELALSEINQNDGILYVAAFRDVTDRKQVERTQREFISIVSHELRTPLTSISGALKLFMHLHGTGVSPDAKRLIDIANRNAQRLGKLVNDILDIDKLESGKMVFNHADFALEDIIDAAVDAISPFARDNGVTIEFTGDRGHTTLNTDSLRLSQALTNLMSNAIKFSPEGSTVEVRVMVQAAHVRIDVADKGPGIPAEFVPYVFSKFTQASTPGLMYKGGSGLGLSIVKEIGERMGGQVGFESSASGTVFFICLPLPASDVQA